MRKLALLSAIALAALGAVAHAEPESESERPSLPIAPHLNIGIEILGGGEAWSYASRTHLGLDVALGRGGVRPSLGAGVTFAAGSLQVDDPRALSGAVSLGYYEVGPELRLGLRWVDGGAVDPQIFASFAYLRTSLDNRLMLDAVEGVGGTRGMRAALGFNWAQQAGRAARDDGSKNGEWNWLILLLPQQAELSWERSCGSERIGVTLAYGI